MHVHNSEAEEVNALLLGIREGMSVFDLQDNKVGTVRHIQFADDTTAEVALLGDPLVPEAPEPIRRRLLKSGFIRIDTGLLRRDRYATADQINRVQDDRVQLYVTRDELVAL
ncbi:MAG TPA: hypothetical protein VKY59_12735 [Spirillospora sp.]|nr:hypothetical protein [Spirillospora sp.]